MLRNKRWLGIILSILLLVFSIPGFTAYYKYTQESGADFYVGTADKSDALEDTNEMRQIIDDLGALLVHSKRDGVYPKGGDFGGTIQIPEAGLKFSNAPANNDIAAYIAGEMTWQTKVELGLDLSLYYLKTAIDSQGEMEAIWGTSLQPLDTALTNISALTYVSPSLIKLTADDTYAVRTLAEIKTDLAYQLSDMSDVGVTTPTDKYVLVADGDSWESRALVEADISDLGSYATLTGDEVLTNKDISFVNALASDHTYSGEIDSQPVGESVVFGDLLYFNWTDKEWKKAKADVYATTPAERIALESKTDGQTCLMLVKGYIRDDSAFDFGASRIFLNDDTAGTCDDTAPAESGDQIQVVGTAKSADILFFNPSQDVGEI